MRLFDLALGEPVPVLRALKTVALANGELAELEKAMLDSASALLGYGGDVHALAPIDPGDLPLFVPNPEARLGILRACLVMALADGEASTDELAVLRALQAALDVEEPRLDVFAHLAAGRRRLAQANMLRRLAGPMIKKAYRKRGLLGLYHFVRNAKGKVREDTALAWRYRRLGLLPEGTLGREFWKYSRLNMFAFPGEIGGPDELVVNHDFIHVLTGYGTDPASEFEAAAFTAGVTNQDPFAFLYFVMLQFHLGIDLSPVGTTEKGYFPPDRTLRALERGAACRVDVTDGWDHWTVIERPVAELQHEYGIGPGGH